MHITKTSLRWLFIYLFTSIVITLALLYFKGAARISPLLPFKTAPLNGSKITTYCNNKTRLAGSLYVLSYTLFGESSWARYGKNVKKLAEEAEKSSFYRSWTIRVYHELYPLELQKNLTKIYRNLEFCDVRSLVLPFSPNVKVSTINGMTWRFIPMADPTVFIMCSRDLDSDVYKREEDAVRYWMHTNKTLHSMRDHPQQE